MSKQPATLDDFRKERINLYNLARRVVKVLRFEEKDGDQKFRQCPKRHVGVSTQPKEGKREIVEIIALALKQSFGYRHLYISSLSRKDNKEQHEELRKYGIECYVPKKDEQINDLSKHIVDILSSDVNVKLIIHLDESDYGSGERQLLNNIFSQFVDNDHVKFVLYSATNEELEFSSFSDDNVEHFELEDHAPCFRWAYHYLEGICGTIDEAEPFFTADKKISKQGLKCLDHLVKENKTFGVLRLSHQNRESSPKPSDDEIKEIIDYHNRFYGTFIVPRFIDQRDHYFWGREPLELADWVGAVARRQIDKHFRQLLIIKQTCSRSTEIGFHEEIAFWHAFRKEYVYNTAAQGEGRVNFYDMGKEVFIKVYSHIPAFKLMVKRIDKDKYGCKGDRRIHKLSRRITDGQKDKHIAIMVYSDLYKDDIRLKTFMENHRDLECHPVSQSKLDKIRWSKYQLTNGRTYYKGIIELCENFGYSRDNIMAKTGFAKDLLETAWHRKREPMNFSDAGEFFSFWGGGAKISKKVNVHCNVVRDGGNKIWAIFIKVGFEAKPGPRAHKSQYQRDAASKFFEKRNKL